MADQQIINFEQLQSMYHGHREYPVTERGMLQLIECCEREMAKIKDERTKVNRYATVIRDSIKKLLDRLDESRNGELLPFDGQDEPRPDEDIKLDTADWRETVKVEKAEKASKDETFSPDDVDGEEPSDGGTDADDYFDPSETNEETDA